MLVPVSAPVAVILARSAAAPLIVAVTAPFVAASNAFRSVTFCVVADAIVSLTVTSASASFARIAETFVVTAPAPSTRFPKLSLTPAAEKSTVAASVDATIAAPSAADAASFTVIV